ncbi:MAG: AAA family ATPase [Planctomycetia bacterium]|nr:AAA family ATPase [Planctomycetia bacterium]
MLKQLETYNIGPASMKMDFSERLNIFTGDNGLGKSFLLDVVWYALTHKWPSEVNPNLAGNLVALPSNPSQKAKITFGIKGKTGRLIDYSSEFDRKSQSWKGQAGRPVNPGLVLYALADGSFAVWDPARNYWKKKGNIDIQDRLPSYVFTMKEIWDGLKSGDKYLCNGLIADWASWQREQSKEYKMLCGTLETLSNREEKITPGPLKRISLDDARDIPTLETSYGQVFVLHASSGVRRILGLAYLLTWAWKEHTVACDLLGEEKTPQITFLFDEVEAHLHPKWQRTIVPALLKVMEHISEGTDVQLITATHSPLVLASLEPFFDSRQDTWFDLNFSDSKVTLEKMVFEKHGDVSSWLTSPAFDLQNAGSVELENAFRDFENAITRDCITPESAKEFEKRFASLLDEADPFWIRWRYIAEKKGWSK